MKGGMLACLVGTRPQAIDMGLEPSEGPRGYILEATGRVTEFEASLQET